MYLCLPLIAGYRKTSNVGSDELSTVDYSASDELAVTLAGTSIYNDHSHTVEKSQLTWRTPISGEISPESKSLVA